MKSSNSSTGTFNACKSLAKANLTGITKFGQYEFNNCSALHAVTIDWTKVTAIGDNAFSNCTLLSFDNLNLASLTSLKGNAFYGVKIKKLNLGKLTSLPSASSSTQNYGDKSVLEEVTIGGSVTILTANSFMNYTALKSVDIGNITVLQWSVFQNASSLLNIDLSSITEIGANAFHGCTSLKIDKIGHANLTTIGENAFRSCPNVTAEVDCPNLTSLGQMAFFESGITKIISLGTITSFGNQTFAKCKSLQSIVIPNSLQSTGYAAFSNCTSLTGDLVFTNTIEINQQSLEYTAITSIYAPVATLFAYYCCRSCKSLHTVRIPSITSLGNRALESCTALTTLEIGNSCTQIEYAALSGCSSLTSLTLPSSLEIIAQSAFQNTGLTFLDIPATVTEIGSTAFAGSKALTGVIVRNTTPPSLGASAFNNTSDCPIYVPNASVSEYQAAANWSGYATRIKPLSLIEGLSINPSGVTINYPKIQLKTTYDGSVVIPNYSLNSNIATIDANGLLTFNSEGVVVVTASYNGKTATTTIEYSSSAVNIEHGVALKQDGTVQTSSDMSTVGFVQTGGATSIKWGVTGGSLGMLCEYKADGTTNDYWTASANPRTVTIKATSTMVKATFSTANLDDAYIYDNTNGKYLWKGKNVV